MIAHGFDTGDTLLPWGTTLAEACTRFVGLIQSDERSAKFAAGRFLGFDALSATLRAPAMDRPVMQVWYELKHDPTCASDEALTEKVSRALGPPAGQADHEVHSPNPSFGVRHTAYWPDKSFGVGISIYGAPRQTPEGLSSAALYVDWQDEIAAAAPYIEEMLEAEHSLVLQAREAEILLHLSLEEGQRCYGLSAPDNPPAGEALLRARRCLRKRRLYQTPATLAKSMQTNQITIWRNAARKTWCISTKYETVQLPVGAHVTVSHTSLLPAKGSGSSRLNASDLELVSIANSPAISQLAAFLQDRSLASVAFFEDYDT